MKYNIRIVVHDHNRLESLITKWNSRDLVLGMSYDFHEQRMYSE